MKMKCGIPFNEYTYIHRWLAKEYGPATHCESKECLLRSDKFEYALIKGHEYQKKRESFMMLCKSCHLKYDWDENKRKAMRVYTEDRKLKIGASNKGKKRTPEQLVKMSERNRGEKNPFYGKGVKGEQNSWFGRKHTDESKLKIALKNRILTNDEVIKIRELAIYTEQKKIASIFNISRASVCRIVNNKRYVI